jgi:hypothetical protein
MKSLSQTMLCLVLAFLVHPSSGRVSRVIAQTKLVVAADGSGQFKTVSREDSALRRAQ